MTYELCLMYHSYINKNATFVFDRYLLQYTDCCYYIYSLYLSDNIDALLFFNRIKKDANINDFFITPYMS